MKVNWLKDADEALARAKEEKKPLLIDLMSKQWADAESRFTQVAERYPNSHAAPEALYWKGVCRYKITNDHTVLGELPVQFNQYPDSIWALKTLAWIH